MKWMSAERWRRIVDRGAVWVVAIAVFVGAIGLAWGVYAAGQSRSLTQQIRTTQVHSAKIIADLNQKLATVENCQLDAFNAILFDARLAFSGDRNPADYKVAKLKC